MRRVLALLSLALTSGYGYAGSVGDWAYSLTETYYAATINDSGSAFGQWCDTDEASCFYMVAMKTRCDSDDAYPALINTDSGALSVKLICKGKHKERDLYRYVISDFSKVDTLVKSGKRVGIAIPIDSDEFRVIRFSLDGASVAVTAMRSAVSASVNNPGRRDTRDKRL